MEIREKKKAGVLDTPAPLPISGSFILLAASYFLAAVGFLAGVVLEAGLLGVVVGLEAAGAACFVTSTPNFFSTSSDTLSC